MNSRFLIMRLATSVKRKLLKPCKTIAKFFIKLRRRKPLSIKSLRRRRLRHGCSNMMSVIRSPLHERDMDRVTELASFSEAVHQRAPHPSPMTPAYVRMSAVVKAEDDDVEEACRSFEKYLVEMIVEEGKTRDLADVEELLYLWKELRSPVFLDLVCRFYRELSADLFSSTDSHHIHSPIKL